MSDEKLKVTVDKVKFEGKELTRYAVRCPGCDRQHGTWALGENRCICGKTFVVIAPE